MNATKRTFDGLQALRAFAAIIVVLHHASGQILDNSGIEPALSLLHLGDRGVELFFVLSGFIVYYSHINDPRSWASVRTYVRKRLVRLMPAAFIVATAWCLVLIVAQMAGVGSTTVEQVTFGKWASSALLFPMTDRPTPVVIWTLKHELMFYTIFLASFVSVRLSLGLLAIWSAISISFSAYDHEFLMMLTANENILFLSGAISYFAWRKNPGLWSGYRWPAILAISAFAVLTRDQPRHYSLDTLGFAVLCPILILSFMNLDLKGSIGRFTKYLGDASYSIYLIHFPVLAVTYRILQHTISDPTMLMILNSTLAIAAGVVFYALVEIPLLKFINSRFAKQPTGIVHAVAP